MTWSKKVPSLVVWLLERLHCAVDEGRVYSKRVFCAILLGNLLLAWDVLLMKADYDSDNYEPSRRVRLFDDENTAKTKNVA